LTVPPIYFQAIQETAAKRWNQLESDADLAGPWHQLFRQVQSPRHVVSELLQNADDAGATEAKVSIESGTFIFEHNGEDFNRDQFESLCRFGYSNKRTLHTIGFRGIGFKSTFSIGPCVELASPTLSVRFDSHRFTEPHWSSNGSSCNGRTRFSVKIADKNRQNELEKNLLEWKDCPYSLLFFKNLRTLSVGGARTSWKEIATGPVAGSTWMSLDRSRSKNLLIRSQAVPFPAEALAEIRRERGVNEQQNDVFPPCTVDIVMGAPGRLYVVLPTGVHTKLPFACNAPFIQDPARMKIKDPAISPTNRWLLERIGALAGESLTKWINAREITVADRAMSYELLPNVERGDTSLEGQCALLVELATEKAISGKDIILAWDGQTFPSKKAIGMRREIYGIWSEEIASKVIDEEARPVLSEAISDLSLTVLRDWDLVEIVTREDLIKRLTDLSVPRPKTLEQLVALHVYLHDAIVNWWVSGPEFEREHIKIFPAFGKPGLFSSSELVRLGGKTLVPSGDEWSFLSKFLLVLDNDWTTLFVTPRLANGKDGKTEKSPARKQALAVLEECNLAKPSDMNVVIGRVATALFKEGEAKIEDCVALAHMAAKFGAEIDDTFQFVNRNVELQNADKKLIWDDGHLEAIAPPEFIASHFLHTDYTATFRWCSREEWHNWIRSGKACLNSFFLTEASWRRFIGWNFLAKECRRLGITNIPDSRYRTELFHIRDSDFPEKLWSHWTKCVSAGDFAWTDIGEILLERVPENLISKAYSSIFQNTTTKKWNAISDDVVPALWLLRLRELPCLLDRHGVAAKPCELLRRTAETEPLIDVERFVNARHDTPATCDLLDMLGVGNTPTGPTKIIDILKSLASAKNPLSSIVVADIHKWYRKLDLLTDGLDTGGFAELRRAFRSEKIILTADGDWLALGSVFMHADEDDVPGAPIVHPDVSQLALWRKLGMVERPTLALAFEWLAQLPKQVKLSPQDARRVRFIQCKAPERVWTECGHWISKSGLWTSINLLSYLSSDSEATGMNLFSHIKDKIADMQGISEDVRRQSPFAAVVSLSDVLTEKIEAGLLQVKRQETPEWFKTFAELLLIVKFDDLEVCQAMEKHALRLCATRWGRISKISLSPSINDEVVGTPRPSDVVWIGTDLLFEDIPAAKLARRIPEELSKRLANNEIKTALIYSYERPRASIEAYFRENFKLGDKASTSKPVEQYVEDKNGSVDNSLLGLAGDASMNESVMAAADKAVEFRENGDDSPVVTNAEKDKQYKAEKSDPIVEQVKDDAGNYELMDIFAASLKFQPESRDCWKHSNGERLSKVSRSGFCWERTNHAGEVQMMYQVIDHCLVSSPLDITAETWYLLLNNPLKRCLILKDLNNLPRVFTGNDFQQLQTKGQVTLYPTSYRVELSAEE
jgi:hypothetical protein